MNFHIIVKNINGRVFADEWFETHGEAEEYMSDVYFGILQEFPDADAHLYTDSFEIIIDDKTYVASIKQTDVDLD